MKCLDCKHGIPVKGKATLSVNKNNCAIVIKHVPALVCPVCGTYYLDEKNTERVLETGNSAIKNGTEVEIIRLKVA